MSKNVCKDVPKRIPGYALMLDTGAGTHITLVYFYRLKRGYDQYLVTELARQYLLGEGYDIIVMEYGPRWGPCSIHVSGEIAEIQQKLIRLFLDFGYDIDLSVRSRTPHVDLKGVPVAKLKRFVNIDTDWIE